MPCVIVIGGGVLGRAIAQRLAADRIDVCIIYQSSGSHGQASAAAGAMLCVFSEVGSRDPLERQDWEAKLRLQSRRLYPEWMVEIGEASGQNVGIQAGLFMIANSIGADDAAELAAIRAAAERCQGIAARLPWKEIPGLKPASGTATIDALYLADDGSIDSSSLLGALHDWLSLNPLTQVKNDRAQSVETWPGGVRVILQSGQRLSADYVIIAAGVETQDLLISSNLGEARVPPILSGRGVSLVVKSDVRLEAAIRTPNRGFACGIHAVPRNEQAVYLGATNRLATIPQVADRARLSEVGSLVEGATHEINTDFAEAQILGLYVGHRPVTVDKIPVVGRTQNERVLVASGTYRNGVVLAPMIARLISDELQSPGIHAAHPFSPQRETAITGKELSTEWIQRMSRSLVSMLCEPRGSLPYGNDERLAAFIESALHIVLQNSSHDQAIISALADRLRRMAPNEESIPILFDLVGHLTEHRR